MAAPKRVKKVVEEPEACTVCSDIYTPIIRKKVSCKYCKESSCSKCIEQYLLGRHEDAHCLHCRVNYNNNTLHEICTRTYLQQRYFHHRQEVLVNRERANLPGLQQAAIDERKRRDIGNAVSRIHTEIDTLKKQSNNILIDYNNAHIEYNNARVAKEPIGDLLKKMDELLAQNSDIRDKIRAKKMESYDLSYQLRHGNGEGEEKKEEEEKKKFIRRCTRAGCQGFLSTAWKCGICDWYSCSKCFMVKGLEHDAAHECKKEDVETAELIKKDSKPCPNCGEFITKTSGCDQMYCISCQTPWSWNTGKIVTSGPIHNPHYYEWMKRNGGTVPRNPADVPCGGYPGAWELRRPPKGVKKRTMNSFYEFHRICNELQEISTRQYRSHLDNATTHSINVRFLLGDFDEKQWGRMLAINEKKRKRDTEIQEILGAFRMVAVELINRIHNYHDATFHTFTELPPDLAENILAGVNVEVDALVTMINSALRDVSIAYSYTVPFINTVSHEQDHMAYYHVAVKNFTEEVKKRRGKKDASDAAAIPMEEPVEQEEPVEDEYKSPEENEVIEPSADDAAKDLQRAILESIRHM